MAKGLFLNRKYYDVWLDLPLVTACCKGFEEVLEQADQKKIPYLFWIMHPIPKWVRYPKETIPKLLDCKIFPNISSSSQTLR